MNSHGSPGSTQEPVQWDPHRQIRRSRLRRHTQKRFHTPYHRVKLRNGGRLRSKSRCHRLSRLWASRESPSKSRAQMSSLERVCHTLRSIRCLSLLLVSEIRLLPYPSMLQRHLNRWQLSRQVRSLAQGLLHKHLESFRLLIQLLDCRWLRRRYSH